MDQCEKCVVRGNKHSCEHVPCNIRSSWYVEQLKDENAHLRTENEQLRIMDDRAHKLIDYWSDKAKKSEAADGGKGE